MVVSVGQGTSGSKSEAAAHQEDVRVGGTVGGAVPRADEDDDSRQGQEPQSGRGKKILYF